MLNPKERVSKGGERLQECVHCGAWRREGGVRGPRLLRTKSCAPALPPRPAKVGGSQARPRPPGTHSAARSRPAAASVCSRRLAAGSRLAAPSALALPGAPSRTQPPLLASGTAGGTRSPPTGCAATLSGGSDLGQRRRKLDRARRPLRRGGGGASHPKRGGPASAALRAQARTTLPRRRRGAGRRRGEVKAGRGEGGASLVGALSPLVQPRPREAARGVWRRDLPGGQLAVCLPA